MDVTNPRRGKRKAARTLALALALSLNLPAVVRAADPKIEFNIPASAFPQAIIEFYKQSQIEILYASVGSVERIKTRAVVGELEPSVALQKMLEGTGFTFEFENAKSVLVKREEEFGGTAVANKPATGAMRAGKDGEAETPGSGEVRPEVPEVTVTGSYLHGVLDIMSPLISISREQMKAAPYGTVQDALLTLPNNMLSAQNDLFGGIGNFNRGTAPNLRGLGYGATLVLVNGHRQPAGGTLGDFVDVSNIPWSAVDHIDVMADGASALYGSDAVAGVVNIVLRDRLRGAETTFRTGFTPGGAAEKLAAQLFGDEWGSGRWLLAYQYSSRTSLAAADREYTADADKRPFGGRDFRTSRSNPGNILDPSTFAPAFAIPPNQDGRSLTSVDLLPGVVNLQNQFATVDLAPERQMHNVFLSASQKMGDRFELFGEGRYTYRESQYPYFPIEQVLQVPSSNPFFINLLNGPPFMLVAYNFLDDLGPINADGQTRNFFGTFGVRASLDHNWRATLSTSYGREDLNFTAYNQINPAALAAALADPNPETAFNPFGDGSHTNPATLDAIRFNQRALAVSDLTTTSLIADGALLDLPSGTAKLALGLEHRREGINTRNNFTNPPRFAREIESAFAELSVPLIGMADDLRAVPQLELSLAGRYESYSDFGHAFNPKMGLRWVPLDWMKLRTSWGTSFKAPRLIDLHYLSPNVSALVPLPDPHASQGGRSIILGLQGNNPDLKQETATTWTAGLDVTPEGVPGLKFSLTYFNVNYTDQVIQPAFQAPFEILFHEDQWAAVIKRNPSPSEIAAICRRPDFLGSVSECLASSPAAIVDIRLRNLATTKTTGLDFRLEQSFKTRYGDFHFDLNGSYVFSFEQALTKTSPVIDFLNTVTNPLALRLRNTIQWSQYGQSQPGFFASATVNHTGGYRDIESSLHRTIDAWTPVDLQLGYRTMASDSWLGNLEVRLNGVNVFDSNPPFVDRNWGYDVSNAVPYGRVMSLFIEKIW